MPIKGKRVLTRHSFDAEGDMSNVFVQKLGFALARPSRERMKVRSGSGGVGLLPVTA